MTVEDLSSTNGVFVGGERVSHRTLAAGDSAQVGSFLLRVDQSGDIEVLDSRSKTRVDVLSVTDEAKNKAGGGKIKLLEDVSFTIQPNEFVGILGPSGAGKSTLIEAMNGVRPPGERQRSGQQPRSLSKFRSDKTADRLRPSGRHHPSRAIGLPHALLHCQTQAVERLSSGEIGQIIDEVLDVTGLSDRKDVSVNRLSGGQRKRVSMAVELLTKPSVIYLDEPTSGLDPFAEERIMRLFREIAESGRTVVMTTHAMDNVGLFDKIVLLVAGKLVFFGSPADALSHFGVSSFKELYDRLEQPRSSAAPPSQMADELKRKFQSSPLYARNIEEPLKEAGKIQQTPMRKKGRLGIVGSIGQWLTLSRRYFAVLFKDRLNLLILFAQAPLIALLTFLVMGNNQPRDFVYFVVALVAFWFGISVSAREIVRERAVYKRERMFNLGVVPYLFSKLSVLGIVVAIQCVMLFVPLKMFDLAGLMPMPGEMLGVPQLWAMLLTAGVGIAGGLFISTLVRTSETATSLIPLILIPQILFSGLVGVPQGINKVVGLAMPSAWSFDTMKRFSTLDTLETEGADPKGPTKGRGLYKFVEAENEKAIEKAKRDLESLKKSSGAFMTAMFRQVWFRKCPRFERSRPI